MSLYEGIRPMSNARGVIHLTEQKPGYDSALNLRECRTICGRVLTLNPEGDMVDGDVPCGQCRRLAPNFWTPASAKGGEEATDG